MDNRLLARSFVDEIQEPLTSSKPRWLALPALTAFCGIVQGQSLLPEYEISQNEQEIACIMFAAVPSEMDDVEPGAPISLEKELVKKTQCLGQ
jgi:hypothetical protein